MVTLNIALVAFRHKMVGKSRDHKVHILGWWVTFVDVTKRYFSVTKARGTKDTDFLFTEGFPVFIKIQAPFPTSPLRPLPLHFKITLICPW